MFLSNPLLKVSAHAEKQYHQVSLKFWHVLPEPIILDDVMSECLATRSSLGKNCDLTSLGHLFAGTCRIFLGIRTASGDLLIQVL